MSFFDKNLSSKTVNFLHKYGTYLEKVISSGYVHEELSIFFDSKRYEELSGWKIDRFYQMNVYSTDGLDCWFFYANNGQMGYLKYSTGLLLFASTEREYDLFYKNLNPERIGICFPISTKALTNLKTKDILKIMRWKVKEYGDEIW